MSGWWDSATEQQRLAQIDGAIECGMTASQAATCLGSKRTTINGFARRHGRSFSEVGAREMIRHRYASRNLRESFMAGEDVDFWRAS